MEDKNTLEQSNIKEEFSDILAGWAEEEDEFKKKKKYRYIWTAHGLLHEMYDRIEGHRY